MTKARDLANIISGGFTVDDLPTLTASEIPNLDAAKITSGTFADARIAASNVSQHATSFDDNKIVNDISTLGLRVHTQENLSASNTNSASFDTFQDSTGITNLTNCNRADEEFVASVATVTGAHTNDSDTAFLYHMDDNTDSAGTGETVTLAGGASFSTAQKKFGTKSLYIDGQNNSYAYAGNNNDFQVGTGALTVECWVYGQNGGGGAYQGVVGRWWTDGNVFDLRYASDDNPSNAWGLHDTTAIRNGGVDLSNDTWYHLAWTRDGSGDNNLWLDGVNKLNWTNSNNMSLGTKSLLFGVTNSPTDYIYEGYIDEVRLSTVERYTSTFTPNSTVTNNATGSFESVAITAGASTSSMGAVLTYQDNAGTNTLNTDIVLKLSADNGSNYSTATLTALPDFATGIKMAKVNDLSVTAGTQLKYKLEFANQSNGSKEARIRGVSLQY